MPFNYDGVPVPKLATASELSTKRSMRGSLGIAGIGNESLSRDRFAPALSMGHNFIVDRTKICRSCGGCTGFGHGCVILRRESIPPGEDCKCGVGDAGCTNCGLCRTCGKHEECQNASDSSGVVLSPLSSPSLRSPGRPSKFEVGMKIQAQWRGVGGAVYAGVISKVNDNGTYDILYEDGDRDDNVIPERITVLRPPIPRMSRVAAAASALASTSGPGLTSVSTGTSTIPSAQPSSIVRLLSSIVLGNRTESTGDGSSDGSHRSGASSPTSFLGTSSGTSADGTMHVGSMTCRCGHNLGVLEAPLNPSYYHLTGRCVWNCCGGTWESQVCKAATSGSSNRRLSADFLSPRVPSILSPVRPVVASMSPKECLEGLTKQAVKYFPSDTWRIPDMANAIESPSSKPSPTAAKYEAPAPLLSLAPKSRQSQKDIPRSSQSTSSMSTSSIYCMDDEDISVVEELTCGLDVDISVEQQPSLDVAYSYKDIKVDQQLLSPNSRASSSVLAIATSPTHSTLGEHQDLQVAMILHGVDNANCFVL